MGEKVIYSELPESQIIVDFIERRYSEGKYSLILVIGLPGSGKTRLCARLGELINKRINDVEEFPAKRIVDNLLDLVDAIRHAKPGDQIVVEELSVLFPSRRAMAADNVNIGRVLDTCRKKRVILLANAPILKAIDSHIRSMANMSIETLRINKTQGVVIAKPLILQTNPSSGKTYCHRLQKGGRDIQRIFTKKSNEEVWIEYETSKDKFMNKLYDELKHKAIKKNEKLMKEMGKKHDIEIVKPLTPKQIRVYDLIEGLGLTQDVVAKKIGCSRGNVSNIMIAVRKKLKIMKNPNEGNVAKDQPASQEIKLAENE